MPTEGQTESLTESLSASLTESLTRELDFSPELAALAGRAATQCEPAWRRVEAIGAANQLRVLQAFRDEQVADFDLTGSTGYGYGDVGRDKLDRIYARVFGTEAALVRPQLVSGTHALAAMLFGVLRPGDELLAITGTPYDTLLPVIGVGSEAAPGSLRDFGVGYREVPLTPAGRPDEAAIRAAIGAATRAVLIQRSRGYAWRAALSVADIARLITVVKETKPGCLCLVDNCYGEFTETREPGHVGADLLAGSLIKNAGGGIAPTGGYLAGRAEWVEHAAARVTAPGIGSHVGPSLGVMRLLYQGLFLAPHVVGQALQGATFAAALLDLAGMETSPRWDEPRSDLIQALRLGTAAGLIAFCQGLQKFSPVDSGVRPEPWDMPGYSHPVIMAAGTFVQGASIELSADAPLREPYDVFVQGGLTREAVMAGVLGGLQEMIERGLLKL